MSTLVIEVSDLADGSNDLGTLMEQLSLAARLEVQWYAGSMCRFCGALMPSEHAATCAMPDPTDTRRPLEVAIPGDGYSTLDPTVSLAVALVTGFEIATKRYGCVPLARAELRRWARKQEDSSRSPR